MNSNAMIRGYFSHFKDRRLLLANVSSSLMLILLIFTMLLAPVILQAQVHGEVSPELQALILAEDWPQVLQQIKAEKDPSPILRLIKGHACLALNKNNESLCLFLSAAGDSDLQKWQQWAENFATGNRQGAVAHYLRGDALARRQQQDLALSAFNAALQLNPRHALALNARGILLASQGRFDDAIQDFSAAVSAQPALADAYASFGSMWVQKKDGVFGALKAYNQALSLSLEFAVALYGRGCVRTLLGQWKDSERDLRNALKSDCLRKTIAQNIGHMLELIKEQQDKNLKLVGGRIPATEIEKKFLSNCKAIKEGNFGSWGGPLNQNIQLMRDSPYLREVWSNQMRQISPEVNKSLQSTMIQRERSVGDWWSNVADITTKAFVSGGSKNVKMGGEIAVGAKNWADYRMKTGDARVWRDALGRLPEVDFKSPGGFAATLAQANWDQTDWPFSSLYGLNYPGVK